MGKKWMIRGGGFLLLFLAVMAGGVSSANAALGVCDTGNLVEVESTGGSLAGIPVGYGTLAASFSSINGGSLHLGTINVEVCGNTTEFSPATLWQVAGITSVNVKPAGGAARTVSGNFAGVLVNLDGADNVTIDGLNSGGNSLTLSNASTSTAAGTATLRFINDASSNTVTNATILGSSRSALDTVSATIIVGAGTTAGNDNNFVSYCNVGPAGSNLPSKAVIGSGLSATVENDNFRITNSNIYDHFLATGSNSGINVLSGNKAWWIASNRMYQTASRTFTASAGQFSFIRTASGYNGNFIINSNVLGFTNSSGTGTMHIGGLDNEFRAIDARTIGEAAGINYNTIAGLSVTTTGSFPFCGIDMTSTGGTGDAIGNTIGSANGTAGITVISNIGVNSGRVTGIRSKGLSGTTILNNNIGYIYVQGTGKGPSFNGIYVEKNPTAPTQPVLVQGNTIVSVQMANANAVYGISVLFSAATITGNNIRELSNITSVQPGYVIGIQSYENGAELITQNTLHSFSVNSGSQDAGVTGISTYDGDTVARNFVHSFSVATTSSNPGASLITGIDGNGNVWKNNMVRLGIDSAGNSLTLPVRIFGLLPSEEGMVLYHNSVYVGGSNVAYAPGGNGTSACIYAQYGYMTIKDNVFWNARANASSGAIHFAAYMSSYLPFTSDYNVLRATGWGGNTGYYNGVPYSTLAAWQTGTGGDSHSLSGNPMFANATGNATNVNLHIFVVFGSSAVEGNGVSAGISDDYDGQTRSGLTPTDIGADAGNF